MPVLYIEHMFLSMKKKAEVSVVNAIVSDRNFLPYIRGLEQGPTVTATLPPPTMTPYITLTSSPIATGTLTNTATATATPTQTAIPTATPTATPTGTSVPEAAIDFWYGTTQKFGQKGNPQQWINILGNMPNSDANSSLLYSLNGGADMPLTLGPDKSRLDAKGDFNVEIDFASLNPGGNTLLIKASDGTSASPPVFPEQPAYYRLKMWEAGDTEPLEWDFQGFGSATAPSAGSMLLVAHHVDAKFGQVKVRSLEDMRLKVNVTVNGEGSIIFNPDQEDFAYSERVRVAAVPDYGYDFDSWSGDYTGTANPADFRIYRDMDLTAHFTPKPPTKLKINIEGQGTVSKSPNKSEYLWGEQVTLTAIPAADHIFWHWTGDLTGIQNPAALIMDADKEVTAVITPTSEASPKSDDFNQTVLDSDLWTLINPAGDASLSMTGTTAEFSIPAGSAHNMWSANSDALRIMQPTQDQNFEIEAKFVTLPTEKYQIEGILVQQDNDNWLRFDFYHNGSTLIVSAAKTISGNSSNLKFSAINPGSSTNLYVRVARNGDMWTQSYSLNGTDWTTFVVFIQELEVASSGVFVGNAAQVPGSEPAFDAQLDHFFNTAAPIVPED